VKVEVEREFAVNNKRILDQLKEECGKSIICIAE